MKIRSLFLAVLLIAPATFVLCAEAPKKQPEEKTELERKMDKMSEAWKKLKRQVADATQNADSLQLVATIQAAAEEALKLVPARAADVPATERAKFVADYQAGIKKLLESFGKLETALQSGRNEEAVKLVADLGAFQKASHKVFERPDEKKK
jgi:soluble cytochrome b562